MSATVNVLCPNGRRQNVKVSPNTTILQIIEEVCLKQQFDPTLHDIKHGRNVVDVTATFRFSGIPNNAKLEMVVREARRSLVTEVTIALQLETGERRQKQLNPEMSLYDMLIAFQNDNEDLVNSPPPSHPVVIYMRDEIIGVEALKYSTLKSLGILSGKAALRLMNREVDQETLNQITSKIQNEQKRLQKYAALKQSSNQSLNTSTLDSAKNAKLATQPEPMETSNIPSTTTATPMMKVETAVKKDTKPVRDEAENKMDTDSIVVCHRAPIAQDQLPAAPVASVRPRVIREQPPVISHRQQFAEFKFPEETAGQDLYRNVLSEVEPSDYLPCERELVVFSLDDKPKNLTQMEYAEETEDFFEVTRDDLQKMIKHLREQISQDENTPLLTSSMRQAHLEASVARYHTVVIRFHFPDKMVLQAKFKPRETVHSLQKFIKSHLKNPEASFYLYTTPPKQVMKDVAQTLIQAHLVPMSIVYVGFNNLSEYALSDETLAIKQEKESADVSAKASLPETSAASSSESHRAAKQVTIANDGAIRSIRNNPQTQSSTSNQTKMPKWYKPAGK